MKKAKEVKKAARTAGSLSDRKMLVLKIFIAVLVILIIALASYSYSISRKKTAVLNEALGLMAQGDLQSGLDKCSEVEDQKSRAFCYSFYLGVKVALVQGDFSADYGAEMTEEQKASMEREIRKEYAIVCGYDRGNPEMYRLCSNTVLG